MGVELFDHRDHGRLSGLVEGSLQGLFIVIAVSAFLFFLYPCENKNLLLSK
jgi:hypothetical protein